MDKAVSDLIDANYVRHLDGPASGGCFTALVILRATTKDMTLISERWRFDLAFFMCHSSYIHVYIHTYART